MEPIPAPHILKPYVTKPEESIRCRLIRQVSVYLTWCCLKVGISADTVTWTSLIFLMISIICFSFPNPAVLFCGIVVYFVHHLLDHVDGEVARYRATKMGVPTKSYGKYLDNLVHCFSTGLYLAISFSLYLQTGHILYIPAGWICAVHMSDLGGELLYKKLFINIMGNPSRVENENIRSFYLIKAPKPSSTSLNDRILYTMIYPGFIFLLFAILMDVFFSPPVILNRTIPYRGGGLLIYTVLYLSKFINRLGRYFRLMETVDQ